MKPAASHPPVPIIDPARYAGGYHQVPVDESDPRFREPLVPLESLGIAFECYYARTDGANAPFNRPLDGARKDVWLRRSVAEKLAAANVLLRPFGSELVVLDGYRPLKCQQSLWDFYYAKARQARPEGNVEQWRSWAFRYVADPACFDPTDASTWPAHSSGASMDVSLRDLASGALLDMGSRFEELDEISHSDFFERRLAEGSIADHDPRLRHRRLLHWAMTSRGLLNDPFVFWHYDWGNQLYVKTRRALFGDAPDAAWYGYATPPRYEFRDGG